MCYNNYAIGNKLYLERKKGQIGTHKELAF